MRYQTKIGELRTMIRIQYSVVTGSGTSKITEWIDVGNHAAADPPRFIKCRWSPLGGMESWVAQSTQVTDAANVVIRYNPSVNSTCRLMKGNVIYKIIDPTDPDQHSHWLTFKAKASLNG